MSYSYIYQLQDADYASLSSKDFRVGVVDVDDTGMTAQNVYDLQFQGKTLFSYISIGEAEDYRDYWANGNWGSNPPSFLLGENPNWPGNYLVKFWDPAWKQIITDRIIDIVNKGYNGAYLDIVDAYQNAEVIAAYTGTNIRQEMENFVAELSAAAKAINPDFNIIPQNAVELLALEGSSNQPNTAYLNVIDGVGKEDTFYDDNTPTSWGPYDVALIEHAIDAGKFVLSVDYPTQAPKQQDYIEQALGEGYIPFVGTRELGSNIPNINQTIPSLISETKFDDMYSIRTIGDQNANDISGGAGHDILYGLDGNDTITGNNGNDTIYGWQGNDSANGGNGHDKIFADAGDDTVNGGNGNDNLYGWSGNDVLSGDIGNDFISGDEGTDTITGGDGNDTVYTWTGDDQIDAGTGNDYVFGDGGSDSVSGGDGNDILYGWEGADTINGGAGDDFIGGDQDGDILSGGTGNDTIYGGAGNDLISDSAGGNFLVGEDGNDTITGANDPANYLYGGAGNDSLTGGNSGDYIDGGSNADTILGGLAADYIVTGAGADIIKYSSLTESTFSVTDYIVDFDQTQDKFDLSGLGFNLLVAGAPTASNQIGFYYDSGNTIICNNAGFAVLLSGTVALTQADNFIF